MQMVSLFV